jgi:hypothetical protein
VWFERGLGPASIAFAATAVASGYNRIAIILQAAHQGDGARGVVASRDRRLLAKESVGKVHRRRSAVMGGAEVVV